MSTPPSGITSRQSLLIALLIAAALFMENLDATVITTALPQMAASFHTQAVDLNIGITAYVMALAVFIPASSWIADRFGTRSVFTAAVALFLVSSLCCALSTNTWQFTLARLVQGFGGALMVPVGRLAVLRNTAKQDLMQAIAYTTWPGLVAPVLGPPIGGFITTYASWHWIFLLNIPVGLVIMALAWRLIPNKHEAAHPTTFDWLGFALSGLTCLGLMYSLELISQGRQQQLGGVALFVASLILGYLLVQHCKRVPAPLMHMDVMKTRTFAVTIYGGSLYRVVVSSFPFLLPLMFQLGFGMNAFHAGLLVLTLFAGNLGMKPFTSWVLRNTGFRTTLISNTLILAVTAFACALISPETPVVLIILILLVSGLSRSMGFTAFNTLAFCDIPPNRLSHANALSGLTQQLASGLGIAVAAVCIRLGETLYPGTNILSHYHVAFLVIGVLTVISSLDSFTLPHNAGADVSGDRKAA